MRPPSDSGAEPPLDALFPELTIERVGDHSAELEATVHVEDVYPADAPKSIDTKEQVEPLLEAIRNCKNIDSLHLQGFSFGKVAAEHLGNLLAECGSTMKFAYWSDIFVSRTKEEVPVALSSLMSGLIKARAKLITLDLSNNAFGAQGVQSLVEYFKSDLSSELEELNLTNTGLGIGGAKVLSSALSHVKSNLRIIRIGRNRLENEGSIALAEVFKKFSTLEVLEMPQNGIYYKGVKALAEALAANLKLEEFIFSDNTVGPKGSIYLKKVLPKLVHLARLCLDDCLLKNAGARSILKALEEPNLPSLMDLNISSNEISDKVNTVFLDKAIFWRSNFQLFACDNEFSKSTKAFIVGQTMDLNDIEVIFGDEDELDEDEDNEDDDDDDDEDEDVDEDEEEDEEDEDIDVEEEDDDDDDDNISNISSVGDEVGYNAVNLSNIPTTIDQVVSPPCKDLDEVMAFINNTSKENFIKLGTKPMDALMEHLQKINDDDQYTDEIVQLIFKMNIIEQDPKELCSRMKMWEKENSHRSSILANAFLVHLGLMKSEDKKKKICGNSDNCVKSFAKVIKSEDFSPQLRDTIMFVVKEKCSKEKKIGDIESEHFLKLLE